MKIKICDRCKELPDELKVISTLLHISVEKFEPGKLDWWLGRKMEVDLCEPCFKEFWEYKTK